MISSNILPVVIQKHILKNVESATVDHYEKEWKHKYNTYLDIIKNNSMDLVSKISKKDKRGLLLFSYSGSIIYLGPLKWRGRKLEYSRLDSRTDTPNYYTEKNIRLFNDVIIHKTLYCNGMYFKNTSPIYQIAVTPLSNIQIIKA